MKAKFWRGAKLPGWLAVTAMTVALGVGASANAQQQPTGSEDATAEDSGVLQEIMVTAQRRTERLHDVPLSIVAKSGDDLAASGVTNLTDLNFVVPGFQMTTQAGFAHPVIRGINTAVNSAGADSPTAIYIDGVYQSNKGGSLFELADVERVEVLKGPQGTLFGRNAVAGAVSIFTLDPSFEPSGKLIAEAGRYDGDGVKGSPRYMVKGFASLPLIDDVLAMSVSGFYETVDGYLTNDRTGGRGGEIERAIGRVKLLYKPREGIRFVLSTAYNKTDDLATGSNMPLKGNTVAAFYPDGIIPVDPWHFSSEFKDGTTAIFNRYKSISLKAEFDIGEAGTLTSTSAYTHSDVAVTLDASSAYSPLCRAAFACVLFDAPSYGSKTFQQELNFASGSFGPISFVGGAFLYRDYSDYITQVFPVLNPDGTVDRTQLGLVGTDNDLTTKAYAGYGEVNYRMTDQLTLIGGLRYSNEKKSGWGSGDINTQPRHPYPSTGPIQDHAWTPRLSARYDISDALNVYATFSKGFKSAVADSDGGSDSQAAPEKLTAYEVGMKLGTPTLNLNTAAFYYDYKDLQVYYFDGLNSILDNAANSEMAGLEADLSVLLSDGVTLSLGGSWLPLAKYKDYQDVVDYELPNSEFGMTSVIVNLSHKRMLSAPKFTGNASLAYEHNTGWGKIDSTINLYYSSSLDWDPLRRVSTGAYTTLNLQVGLTPTGRAFRLGVYGNNLTNKAAITGYILSALTDGVIYNEPRQFGVTAQYSF